MAGFPIAQIRCSIRFQQLQLFLTNSIGNGNEIHPGIPVINGNLNAIALHW